tara:strand:+ start:1678 stop:2049 length:372 start_codon:yes stop_codon:yes gene_type:complete
MNKRIKKKIKTLAKQMITNRRNDRLKRREELAATISEKASYRSHVAIVYGGRDCDMVQWRDEVALVPATVSHVEQWTDKYMAGAEGPQWWRVASTIEAALLRPSKRDLIAEAHEDGHPHVIYV